MNAAAFLDRDGTLNERAAPHRYIKRVEELVILDGVCEALRSLSQSGYRLVVVSNQRGVGRGIVSWKAIQDIERELQLRCGGLIDSFYYCAHLRSDRCSCRKPLPGMLIRASGELGLDLSSSWMIGDQLSDIEAGSAAGTRTALITDSAQAGEAADLSGVSLLSIADQITRS